MHSIYALDICTRYVWPHRKKDWPLQKVAQNAGDVLIVQETKLIDLSTLTQRRKRNDSAQFHFQIKLGLEAAHRLSALGLVERERAFCYQPSVCCKSCSLSNNHIINYFSHFWQKSFQIFYVGQFFCCFKLALSLLWACFELAFYIHFLYFIYFVPVVHKTLIASFICRTCTFDEHWAPKSFFEQWVVCVWSALL